MRRRLLAACSAVVALGASAAACSSTTDASSSGDDAPTTSGASWTTTTVDAGGTSVSVQCMGSGAPTVWLVSDLGLTGAEGWDGTGVAEGLADQVQVCTNDRPGLGASGPATSDRTVEQQADDLAAVIEASGASTPVVVVGQGAGTFIARMLAQRSLPLVAGMVLIDPVLWTSNAEPSADASAGVVAELAGLDLVDADLGGYGSAALPPPPVPTVVLGASHTRPARSSAGDTGTTLTAADLSPSDDERHTRQEALANKSPFGSFVLVEDAGSSIQHWDPDAVIAAVESVLASPNLKSS